MRRLLILFQRLDRGRMLCQLNGISAGEEVALSRELVVTAFATTHTIPSVGYIVWDRRNKLKEEYQGLPGERIRDLRQRWRQETGSTANSLDQFTAWLVARHVVTEYQATVIGRGNGEQLYLGPYRIVERIGRGARDATTSSGSASAARAGLGSAFKRLYVD